MLILRSTDDRFRLQNPRIPLNLTVPTAHDRISINAHIEDRNQLDERKKLTVIVLTASKDDIDLFTIKKIDLDTFKERLHVLQY